jgi:hypothetical protein
MDETDEEDRRRQRGANYITLKFMAFYFESLIVWQKAFSIVEKIYTLLQKFPKEETYALADQMRRASVSIPSNIAE